MSDTKIIRSLDELFIYALEVDQGLPLLPIQLDGSFFLTLHIDGPSWDNRLDKRSAQYIISLQSAFDNLIEDIAPDIPTEKLLIKVNIKKGSLESVAEITDFLKSLVSKMNDSQIFYFVITALAATAGYLMWSRYQQRKENRELEHERTEQMKAQETGETARERERQETLRAAFVALQSRADNFPDQFASYERPMRTMVKMLDASDTVTVGDTNDKIPADMAKKCGPRRMPRSEERTTYADGCYTVKSRNYEEGEIVLELQQGDTVIKGYLSQFDDHDKEAFIQSLNKHEHEDELPFTMDLQLNVIHTKRKLKYSLIIGEGMPRKGKTCIPLDSILSQ